MTENDTTVRLRDILAEIKALIDEAEELVRDTSEERRADGWISQLRCALDTDHDYLGESMYIMLDTIRALEGEGSAAT